MQPDDVEKVSQLLAGELSPEEAASCRAAMERDPELRQAWERLRALDELTHALAEERAPAVNAIVDAVVRPRSTSRRWLVVAAGLVVLALSGWLLRTRAPSDETTPPETFVAKPRVASVQLVGANSQVLEEGDGVQRLVRGTALFTCEDCVVLAGEERLTVRGRALVSREPLEAQKHVTSIATLTPEEIEMLRNVKTSWAIAAFAVQVLSGEVLADPRGAGPDQVLKAGQGKTKERQVAPVVAPFDFAELKAAIEPERTALTRCAELALPGDGELRLVVKLSISATGSLERLSADLPDSIGAGPDQPPAVESCLSTAFSRMKLPAPKTHLAATVSYPLLIARTKRNTVLALPSGDCDDCVPVADRAERFTVEVGQSPSVGPVDAPVTVVLFSEAECSFCVKAHDVLKQLQKDYAGRVRFVFKHYPLPSHRGALEAARALHAAHAQHQFWELLDSAYGAPVSTESGVYDAQARALGLDLQQYRRDVVSKETAAVIDADIAEAKRLGVKGVPAWFINGKEVVGFRPVEVMRQEIDAEFGK